MVFNKKWFLVILASFSLTGTALAAKKRKYATGLIVPADKDFGVPFLAPAEHSIPPNYDLREEGLASPVKNQGSCGSCWAFAGIASMESAVMKVNGGTEMDLSEQQIVSCDQEAQGCSGGWQPFEFMVANGVGAEASFPYAARNLSCKEFRRSPKPCAGPMLVLPIVEPPYRKFSKRSLILVPFGLPWAPTTAG